jgi:fibronectin type 3 domain-containing protein
MRNLLIITSIFLAGITIRSNAQEAKPAGTGIYIDLGKNIPKRTSYTISRKAADSTVWKEIAGLHFQPDSAVFFAALAQAGTKYPTFQMPERRFFKNIWTMVMAADVTDSIFYYGGTPAFKEALNTAYYDQTASPNVNYEYRIAVGGQELKTLKSKYPQTVPTDYQLMTQTISPYQGKQVLRYYSNGINKPAGIKLLRRVYMQTNFEPASAYTGLIQKGDSTIYLAVDTVIQPRMVYQYAAIPFDDLGNPGLSSDTVRISNTTFNNTAFVTDVKTASREKESAIQLSWKLDKTPNVKSVNIYRSEDHGGTDYQFLASVSATDTVFFDWKVHPVKNYFYVLQPVTIYGPGAMSIRFSGMLKANKKAIAPGKLMAVVENGRVRLSWKRPEFYTRGYYIYRRTNATDSLKQVSGLIVTDSTTVVYVDSIQLAQNKLSYTYAVKAVNTSYSISGFSEMATVSAPAGIRLNTPVKVRTIVRDGVIMVYWDNKQANVLGYNLYKRKIDAATTAQDFELVNATSFHFSRNYYEDLKAVKGVDYQYAVQAVSVEGQTSALSEPVKAGLSIKRILPVGGLKAYKKQQSIVVAWDLTGQPDVNAYKIYRLNGETKSLLATLDKMVDFYEDKTPGLKDLNTYTITCVSSGSESEQSTPVSIRTK